MSTPDRDRLREIRTFPSLVKYLRDELGWPIESDDFEDITFDYVPEELGIDMKTAAKIEEIKQLRPLVAGQPWGIFFVKFEPKRLPVVALRRILRSLVIRTRQSASRSKQPAWHMHDLLFISAYGEGDTRQITFAHFAENGGTGALPTLKVLGWDDADTALHIEHADKELCDKLAWPDDEADVTRWHDRWCSAFTLRHREVITTSMQLAVALADLARAVRRRVNAVLAIETEEGPLRRLMAAFRGTLIHDLNEDDFADTYAQTIAYGLLCERFEEEAGGGAGLNVVRLTNPFLGELLDDCRRIGREHGLVDFDELGVGEIEGLLHDPNTRFDAILRDFGDRTRTEDPVIYFYELFLNEYDHEQRIRRGEFYTPPSVVSFIVRSVDHILRTEFGLEDGLADTTTWAEMASRHSGLKVPDGGDPGEPFVQVLDPACGTGTFLVEVIDTIYTTMKRKWAKEGHAAPAIGRLWNEYVPKHLLPRLYGFELKMAPYAIAHMTIALKLVETRYWFGAPERVRVCLTNSLEEARDFSDRFEFAAPALAHEARAANAVKRGAHPTVVVGNPPYSYESQNTGEWIMQLVRPYYEVDGERLRERNPRGLQDDYVKFIRFAQWRIEQTGLGVLGFITNHGYLDNPTFRGMRQSLMKSFDDIYILNLHGNSLKKETSPDGSKDENVFDIQPGVAIGVLVGRPVAVGARPRILYADLWGPREAKYAHLRKADVASKEWTQVSPGSPFYLFIPQDAELQREHRGGTTIVDVFCSYATGLYTARDRFAVQWTADELWGMVQCFAVTPVEKARELYELGPDTQDWGVHLAQEDVRASGPSAKRIVRLLYRPFDYRFTYFTGRSRGYHCRPRGELMRHLLKDDNLALITSRLTKGEQFAHAQVSRTLVEKISMSPRTSNNGFVFPLYLYPDPSKGLGEGGPTWPAGKGGRRPNLAPEFVKEFSGKLEVEFVSDGKGDRKKTFGPEDVFSYIYAVLHSPTYRERYAGFLKIDFPRVPLASDPDLFRQLCALGDGLVALHLLESPRVDRFITKWRGDTPSGEVEKVSYADGTVWIDKARRQGFRGVPEAVWNFHVGGYQVCEKWLKDRKGRQLSEEDIAHYQKVVVALAETIRLMAEIDTVITAHGGWPHAFVTPVKGARSARGS